MARGDHLKANRGGYQHHGIDLGDGTVVHFTSTSAGGLQILRSHVSQFAPAQHIVAVAHESELHPDITCILALRLLELGGYGLFSNNCEHIAWFCKTGSKFSAQLEQAKSRVLADIRRTLPMNPFIGVIGAPLKEVLRRATEAVWFRIRYGFEAPDPPAAASEIRAPLMFREARIVTDRSGRLWRFDGISWVGNDGRTLETDAEAPEIETDHGLWWLDEDMKRFWQKTDGWYLDTGRYRWRKLTPFIGAFDDDQRLPIMAAAPCGALNALIEAPSNLDELAAALNEIRTRGFGDGLTYRRVLGWATADPEAADPSLREKARDTVAMAGEAIAVMHHVQGAGVPGDRLVGFTELAHAARDERTATPIRLTAIDALGLMWRSPREGFESALVAAAHSKTPEVASAARTVLQRVRGGTPAD